MPVSLDIYGGLMAQNNKAISEKAYNFHSATSSIREIAEWFIDYLNLGSTTNLKTVDSVKKLIDDATLRKRLGVNGQKSIKHLSVDSIGAQWQKLMTEF